MKKLTFHKIKGNTMTEYVVVAGMLTFLFYLTVINGIDTNENNDDVEVPSILTALGEREDRVMQNLSLP